MFRQLALLMLVTGCLACKQDLRTKPAAPATEPYQRIDVHLHADPQLLKVVLRLGANVGIERFVNLSGGTLGPMLEANLEAARAFGGRILNCTNLQWNYTEHAGFGERMAAELDQAAALGAACLKVPKVLGLGVSDESGKLLRVDDPRLKPVWTAAGKHGLPVFIHVGDPKAFWKPVDKNNERYDELVIHPHWSFADPQYPRREELLQQFENLLKDNPGTIFVGVHFGNDPEDIAATDRRMDAYPNLWIDTAARVGEIGRAAPDKLRAFFIKHQDRVLFGTDLGVTAQGIMLGSTDGKEPSLQDTLTFFARHWQFFETRERKIAHPTPIQGRWTVDAIGLPPVVLRKFYRDNAIRLLHWPAPTPLTTPIKALPIPPAK